MNAAAKSNPSPVFDRSFLPEANFEFVVMGDTHYMLDPEAYAPEFDSARFWSDRAIYFYPEFKIATIDLALKFSFERFPRYCFERNHYHLPFGCHAWHKWDRSFWEPYLIL